MRGLGGAIIAFGWLVSFARLGLTGFFFLQFVDGMSADIGFDGPPKELLRQLLLGFGVMFGGFAITGIGSIVRGFERPTHR